MKTYSNISYFFISLLSLGVIFGSCQQESSLTSEKQNGEITFRSTAYLFHTINVATDLNGYYYFTDSLSIVESQVEYIFTVRNLLLSSVDEFGFDTTALGTQYFYATQYDENGAKTVFTFLNSESGAIHSNATDGDGAHGWTCSNKHCCEKCVPHDSLICTCHTTQDDCILGTHTPSCIQDITAIN